VIDPEGGEAFWVVDRVDDRVYAYAHATMDQPGDQLAESSFDLIALNGSPEGIAAPDVMRDTSNVVDWIIVDL
jgi:hypothetical protein